MRQLLQIALWAVILFTVQCHDIEKNTESSSFKRVGQVGNPYSDLKAALLNGYDPAARPGTPDKGIVVSMGLTVLSISVDEYDSTVSANTFLQMMWQDERLQWNPADQNNIQALRLPAASVWIPDIALYNEIPDIGRQFAAYDKLVLIYNNGTVLWVPDLTLKGASSLNLSKFPRDIQNCSFKFGSWTYEKREIDLELVEKPIQTQYLMRTGEWKIVSFDAERTEDVYPGVEGTWVSVEFSFFLLRNFSSYCVTLYAPLIACMIASFVNFYTSRRRPTFLTEHTILSMLITSVLTMIVMYHSALMKISAGGVPNIFGFIGMLIIIEALFLPLKAVLGSFMMSVKEENKELKPLPKLASAIINLNSILTGKAKHAKLEGDENYLVTSDKNKNHAGEWDTLGSMMWLLMSLAYVISFGLAVWNYLV